MKSSNTNAVGIIKSAIASLEYAGVALEVPGKSEFAASLQDLRDLVAQIESRELVLIRP